MEAILTKAIEIDIYSLLSIASSLGRFS